MIFTDNPRLQVHGVSPDGSPRAVQAEWDSNARRFRVFAVGTRTLGYVSPVSVRYGHGSIRTEYCAVRGSAELGNAATLEDAAAMVVAAAHVGD